MSTAVQAPTVPPGRYEIVKGARREKPPMGAFAGAVASMLVQLLGAYLRDRRLGLVLGETLFRFRPDRPQRRPDLAYVAFDRLPSDAVMAEDPAVLDAAPNLAVEVVSPTNTAAEIVGKIAEYFDAGVQAVWVVYPVQRCVYVYSSPTAVRVAQVGDELDGGTVLPGFRLKIDDLFAAVSRPK